MAPLSRERVPCAAHRASFRASPQTLNHILRVDLYYLGALHGERRLRAHDGWLRAERRRWPSWRARQAASDARLIALLRCARCRRRSTARSQMTACDHVQRDRVGHVLAHLFNHQMHHRGQAHAMLSGTAVKPPQLDEFLMPSEAASARARHGRARLERVAAVRRSAEVDRLDVVAVRVDQEGGVVGRGCSRRAGPARRCRGRRP